LTFAEAQTRGYCQACCAYRNGVCQATALAKLNYRGASPGECDLTDKEMAAMSQDYGTDRSGNIKKKGKR